MSGGHINGTGGHVRSYKRRKPVVHLEEGLTLDGIDPQELMKENYEVGQNKKKETVEARNRAIWELKVNTTVNTRIKAFRLSRGWTVEDGARRVGMSPRSLSGIENGRKSVASFTLRNFMLGWGISADDLLMMPGQKIGDGLDKELEYRDDENIAAEEIQQGPSRPWASA